MARKTPSRIRLLANRYADTTGENVYAGVDANGRHYFSDGVVYGYDAALQHMISMCQRAGIEVQK